MSCGPAPGIKRQKIPTSVLSTAGSDTLHDLAIRALDTISGHEKEKFQSLSKLVLDNRHMVTAVNSMLQIPAEHWESKQIAPLTDNLTTYISKIPARNRTAKPALQAMELTDKLASKLPADQAAQYRERLADLKINTIRIGTVPERMIFDKEKIFVQAGKTGRICFHESG